MPVFDHSVPSLMERPNEVEAKEESFPTAIPLGARLTTRFYLLLILHTSLKTIFKTALRLPEIETVPTNGFRAFVSKLAHICDSAKGREKATAFAVLQLGTIRYYFTSNERDEEDYQRTSHYVAGILNILGTAGDDEVRSRGENDGSLPIFSRLLRNIIAFNQSRIKGYIGNMVKKIDFCIDAVRRDVSAEGQNVLRDLQHLKPLVGFLENGSGTIEEFVDGSQRVIQAVNQLYVPSLREFLRQRTRNNTDREAPWGVIHHSIGRLMSYYHAISILLAARRNWPQLFVDFEVYWFPSSTPRSVSIPRGPKLNASLIIGKMTDNSDETATYRGYIRDLENSGFALHKTIIAEAHDPDFLPYVHAEVNLLDNLLHLPDNPQFFLDSKYIGTSKPTCRLCELWFFLHPSGVQVREGHKGLYSAWRTPDVFTEAEAEERKKILNRMIPLVREEVFLSLREKFLYRRPNNSRDTPSSLPPDRGSVFARAQVAGVRGLGYGDRVFAGDSEMDDLSSNMGQMNVDDAGYDEGGWDFRSRGEVLGVGEFEGDGGAGEVSHTLELTDGSTVEEYAEGDLDSDDDGGGARL